MSNDYFTRTFDVLPGARVGSQALEDQIELIEQGFELLPGKQALAAGQGNYAVAGGVADTYTLAMSAQVTSLSDGLTANVKFPTALANATTTPTINVNSLGAKSIVRQDGSAVAVGDLVGVVILTYNTTAGKFMQVSGAGLAAEAASAASAAAALVSENNAATSETNAAASEVAAAASEAAALISENAAAASAASIAGGPVASINGLTGIVTIAATDLAAAASQGEMEAGTEAAIRSMSPLRVGQAIAAQVPSATQAEQEAASSTTKVVTPGRQHFHPSAAKLWLKCDAAGAIQASYNVTSITDTGTGNVTVTIATDFSSADYAVVGSVSGVNCFLRFSTQAAGSFDAFSLTGGGASTDPTNYFFGAFGDQA